MATVVKDPVIRLDAPRSDPELEAGVQHVPRLVVSHHGDRRRKSYCPDTEYQFRYEAKRHVDLPHVVKFSGGRSSGMLLFTLLENDILKADRGDVIVFNNTSAEHPATYDFVRHCKTVVEERYGIPFFWVEFQTYEDARNGEWTRLPSYRLVKPVPFSESTPDGFHWRGEVFEEMLSWSGFVPNQFTRNCTNNLKLRATRDFLRDWFACKDEIERLGHHGHTSRLDPDVMHGRHKENGGGVPRKIYLEKKQFVMSRPTSRPSQKFLDFSPSFRPVANPALLGKSYGQKAFFGKGGIEYVAFVGLRYDEMRRVMKVQRRNSGGPESDGYEGEYVYMPLSEMRVTKPDVTAFWTDQEWDLQIEPDAPLSNCTFCFLKGVANLKEVRASMQHQLNLGVEGYGSLLDTPADLNWWIRMEQQYGRDLDAEDRPVREGLKNRFVGFFGTSRGFSYETLSKAGENKASLKEFEESILPCDCTE